MTNRIAMQRGFSLIELAISIFIIALLLGSIMLPLATQVEQRQISETQKSLEEIRDALLGFAAVNGYLPCPDATSGTGANDGVEDYDAATGICNNVTGTSPNKLGSGNIPWATLGLGSQDTWGNRFRYAVLDNFSRRSPATTFGLTTSGGLRVCAVAACTTQITSSAIAVIISHGRNGYGAINANTGVPNVAPASSDELENADNDRDAVSKTQSNIAASEFDDIVVWVPLYTLHNRMISAGKLP